MRNSLVLIFAISILLSCEKNNDNNSTLCKDAGSCENCINIDKNLYNQTRTDNYSLNNIQVNGDCLEITFSSSGCDGNNWNIQLIDLGAISETSVLQRNLKLRLESPELCDAYITRTISFNLKSLQLNNYNKINLKVADWDNLITYQY